jgi:alkyl hydroperoxide reductase subunit AhpC
MASTVTVTLASTLGHGVNELLRAFDRLQIVFYKDTVGPADWNGGKPAPIVWFIARKE